jgi:hypothetical protein
VLTGFEKSGWALSYLRVSWRNEILPILRVAEKETDPTERAAFMRLVAA